MATVIAVVDADGRQAGLLRRLSGAALTVGLEVVGRTHAELATEVSVVQSPGQAPLVVPDRPLLWLSASGVAPGATPDERFLHAERTSAARSIATLTASPVLNRPSASAPFGTFPGSNALAARRSRHVVAGARPERFTSSGPAALDEEVFDYSRWTSSFGTPAGAVGPFRRRPARPGAVAMVVTVGDHVIEQPGRASGLDEDTADLARSFALDLAVVWWLVADAGEPAVARIEGTVSDTTLLAGRIPADLVAAAIIGWVAPRLAEVKPVPA